MPDIDAIAKEGGFAGGIEFMRRVEKSYGTPPEQRVGSCEKARFEKRDNRPVLVKLPELGGIYDGPGKPVKINPHIGRWPIAAIGNPDGDRWMLQ